MEHIFLTFTLLQWGQIQFLSSNLAQDCVRRVVQPCHSWECTISEDRQTQMKAAGLFSHHIRRSYQALRHFKPLGYSSNQELFNFFSYIFLTPDALAFTTQNRRIFWSSWLPASIPPQHCVSACDMGGDGRGCQDEDRVRLFWEHRSFYTFSS